MKGAKNDDDDVRFISTVHLNSTVHELDQSDLISRFR
jgi:hypothetical protein